MVVGISADYHPSGGGLDRGGGSRSGQLRSGGDPTYNTLMFSDRLQGSDTAERTYHT